MRANRYFAQRGPRTGLSVSVDGCGALCPDGKFRRVRVIQDDLHRVLALWDGRRWLLKLGDLITR